MNPKFGKKICCKPPTNYGYVQWLSELCDDFCWHCFGTNNLMQCPNGSHRCAMSELFWTSMLMPCPKKKWLKPTCSAHPSLHIFRKTNMLKFKTAICTSSTSSFAVVMFPEINLFFHLAALVFVLHQVEEVFHLLAKTFAAWDADGPEPRFVQASFDAEVCQTVMLYVLSIKVR